MVGEGKYLCQCVGLGGNFQVLVVLLPNIKALYMVLHYCFIS